jgi:hypothetical protein
VLHGAIFLAPDCPARGRRLKPALRAPLRGGFASLDPAATLNDPGACKENGADWAASNPQGGGSMFMEADGYLGQRITFDGQIITVMRRKKEVRFRASDVRTIQWKDARKWWNGEVKFVVPGASDAPQTGNYWTKTGKDESHRYTVTFLVEQTDAMRAVCDAIQHASDG